MKRLVFRVLGDVPVSLRNWEDFTDRTMAVYGRFTAKLRPFDAPGDTTSFGFRWESAKDRGDVLSVARKVRKILLCKKVIINDPMVSTIEIVSTVGIPGVIIRLEAR